MSQIKVKAESKTRQWDAKLRFRVGDTVEYNGSFYVNTTGANSEPKEISDDWIFTGLIERGKSILIGGNVFDYRPMPDNNTGAPAAGDIACNGWITGTRFGLILVYVAGDPALIGSWDVHSEL